MTHRHDVGFGSLVGVLMGALTAAGTYTLYPPAPRKPWPLAALGGGSLIVVVVLYLVSARLGRLRAGDWLVLGYAIALVLAAALVMSQETLQFLRDHVPQNLGVATSALTAGVPARA